MNATSNDIFLRAVCGALGSVVSMTLLYPLETLRTRLQIDPSLLTQKRKTSSESYQYRSSLHLIYYLYMAGGFSMLYRGWASLVLALSVTNFVYFYSFYGLREFFLVTDQQIVSTDFACGIIAGILTVIVSNPFWVINIRLKLQGTTYKKGDNNNNRTRDDNYNKHYHGIIHCFLTIIRNKDSGIASLWSGSTSSFLLVLNPTIQFVTYEALKRWNILGASPLISITICHAINSAIAKMIATIVTYPLQVIQTRCSAGYNNNKNTLSMQIKKILLQPNKNILQSLFCGLESKLLQTTLTTVIMFLVYEKLVYIVKLYLQ